MSVNEDKNVRKTELFSRQYPIHKQSNLHITSVKYSKFSSLIQIYFDADGINKYNLWLDPKHVLKERKEFVTDEIKKLEKGGYCTIYYVIYGGRHMYIIDMYETSLLLEDNSLVKEQKTNESLLTNMYNYVVSFF